MDLNLEKSKGLLLCTLDGELAADTAPQLQQEVMRLKDNPEAYVDGGLEGVELFAIDLRKVTFIDSSGIGALVAAFKRLKEISIRMAMIADVGQPSEMLRFLRVDKVVPLYEDLDSLKAKEKL